jgi:hypothetical protein
LVVSSRSGSIKRAPSWGMALEPMGIAKVAVGGRAEGGGRRGLPIDIHGVLTANIFPVFFSSGMSLHVLEVTGQGVSWCDGRQGARVGVPSQRERGICRFYFWWSGLCASDSSSGPSLQWSSIQPNFAF